MQSFSCEDDGRGESKMILDPWKDDGRGLLMCALRAGPNFSDWTLRLEPEEK